MKTISITSKGQITIPAEVQRSLNLRSGDQLVASINIETREITLRKPMTVDEVAAKAHAVPRKKVKPLVDVHEYYERERTKEIVQRMKENS